MPVSGRWFSRFWVCSHRMRSVAGSWQGWLASGSLLPSVYLCPCFSTTTRLTRASDQARIAVLRDLYPELRDEPSPCQEDRRWQLKWIATVAQAVLDSGYHGKRQATAGPWGSWLDEDVIGTWWLCPEYQECLAGGELADRRCQIKFQPRATNPFKNSRRHALGACLRLPRR